MVSGAGQAVDGCQTTTAAGDEVVQSQGRWLHPLGLMLMAVAGLEQASAQGSTGVRCCRLTCDPIPSGGRPHSLSPLWSLGGRAGPHSHRKKDGSPSCVAMGEPEHPEPVGSIVGRWL